MDCGSCPKLMLLLCKMKTSRISHHSSYKTHFKRYYNSHNFFKMSEIVFICSFRHIALINQLSKFIFTYLPPTYGRTCRVWDSLLVMNWYEVWMCERPWVGRGNSKGSFSSRQETGKSFSSEMHLYSKFKIRKSLWGYRPSASPSYEASSHVNNYSGKLLYPRNLKFRGYYGVGRESVSAAAIDDLDWDNR